MTPAHPVHRVRRNTEVPPAPWHPAKISDRKLIELRQRLVKVQRLGGPFALIGLSEQARRRLALLDGNNQS